MRILVRSFLMIGLVAFGYGLGRTGLLSSTIVLAQDQAGGPSEETVDKIKAATEALRTAMLALSGESLYEPAITGINAFAVTAGGVDSLQDLETGRGVDPETFAALYAGLAIDEVAAHLGRDDQGRLTYKDKVIRMYPISRLRKVYDDRARLLGEEDAVQ